MRRKDVPERVASPRSPCWGRWAWNEQWDIEPSLSCSLPGIARCLLGSLLPVFGSLHPAFPPSSPSSPSSQIRRSRPTKVTSWPAVGPIGKPKVVECASLPFAMTKLTSKVLLGFDGAIQHDCICESHLLCGRTHGKTTRLALTCPICASMEPINCKRLAAVCNTTPRTGVKLEEAGLDAFALLLVWVP